MKGRQRLTLDQAIQYACVKMVLQLQHLYGHGKASPPSHRGYADVLRSREGALWALRLYRLLRKKYSRYGMGKLKGRPLQRRSAILRSIHAATSPADLIRRQGRKR